MLDFDPRFTLAGDAGWLVLLALVATGIVRVTFAIGVLYDASRRSRWQKLLFVGSGIWALATVLGGVPVAVAYWLVHASILARQPAPLPSED